MNVIAIAGNYYDNSRVAGTSAEAQKDDDMAWLWQQSEQLTGVQFKI
jgi:hypothetical protein